MYMFYLFNHQLLMSPGRPSYLITRTLPQSATGGETENESIYGNVHEIIYSIIMLVRSGNHKERPIG